MNQTGGTAWRRPARTSRIGLEGALFTGASEVGCLAYTRAPSLAIIEAPKLLEFDGLVLAILIKRRSPDLVRRLMFGAAKTERRSKTQIQIAHALQRVDEPFGVELRSGTRHRLDQHARRKIAL